MKKLTQYLKFDSRLPPYMAYPRFLLKVDISETAKLVYMLLLDRARLSMKNEDWQDEKGRVFVRYTISDLARDIGKGETTVKKDSESTGPTGPDLQRVSGSRIAQQNLFEDTDRKQPHRAGGNAPCR